MGRLMGPRFGTKVYLSFLSRNASYMAVPFNSPKV